MKAKVKRVPGEILSDLSAALEEPEKSRLVQLETTDELDLFERLRQAARSGSPPEGMTLFRLGKRGERGQLFHIFLGERQAVLTLERTERAWEITGIRPGPQRL